MKDLIERLEALTGPCRECDALIELAVGDNGPAIQKLIDGSPHNTIDEIAKAADREASSLWFRIPAYTASIDAAMTLVPDGLPWALNYPANDDGSRSCHGIPTKPTADVCGILGHAATPAIALCIAALKATQ